MRFGPAASIGALVTAATEGWSSEELLQRGLAAARAAGDLLAHERPDVLAVASKSTATDAVTEMDRASEALLVERLLADSPGDAVLGEEGGERRGSTGVRWVLDPLDGTVNYLYRIPEWAVSVAAEVDGRVVAAVVHAPVLGVTWWAQVDGGAWRQQAGLDAQRISVGTQQHLDHALVATGFGYSQQRRDWQGKVLARVITQVRDVRRAGAAAIDLCRVADATLDGMFERGLQEWDHAAGGLIVREAGGVTGGLPGHPAGEPMTVAGNASLFEQLQKAVDEAVAEVGPEANT